MTTTTIDLSPEQLGKFVLALIVAPNVVGELCEFSTYNRFIAELGNLVAEYLGVSSSATEDGDYIAFSAGEDGRAIEDTGVGLWAKVKDAHVEAVTGRVHGDDDDSLFVYNVGPGEAGMDLAFAEIQSTNEISDEDLADERTNIYMVDTRIVTTDEMANISALRQWRRENSHSPQPDLGDDS